MRRQREKEGMGEAPAPHRQFERRKLSRGARGSAHGAATGPLPSCPAWRAKFTTLFIFSSCYGASMTMRGAALPFLLPVLLGVLAACTWLLARPHVAAGPTHSTLVVLGAAQYSGRPSPAFKRRLDHALSVYRAGGVQTIVVTGGRQPGDPYTEGEVGAAYLRARGVPGSALIAEARSRTTAENLRGARMLLPPDTPVTLITDEAHAPRALVLARALGLTANANPSPLSRNPDLRYLLREKFALLGYTLLGLRG